MLVNYGNKNYRFYIDDGISGTTFNRPGFQQMIADIEAGLVKRVIIKDMSRLGRDYLQVGMYTEIMFPEHDIHFIAVNDGVDSTQGDNEFTPFRNIINEWYAKDTSKKIRAVMKVKGNAGEHLTTLPPYGYMKSPDNKKLWVRDEEAATVVYHTERRDGRWVLGYRTEPEHRVVDVLQDPLACPEINAELPAIRASVFALLTQGPRAVRQSAKSAENVTARSLGARGAASFLCLALSFLLMSN